MIQQLPSHCSTKCLLGLGSLLLGLVFVVPLLGHASWHAYRDLIDTNNLPLRQGLATTAEAH